MFGSPRTWKQFIQTLWCHNVYGKGHTCGAEMPAHLHPSHQLQGVSPSSQRCQTWNAPTSFGAIRTLQQCRNRNAPRGRIQHPDACYVNHMSILPEQFTGGQLCHAEMPSSIRPHHFYLVPMRDRRNVSSETHQGKGQDMFAEMPCNKRPSQPVKGVMVKTQKCQDIVSPRGPRRNRRNAKVSSPPPNLGHHLAAEMPPGHRPITRGQY